MTSWSIGYTGSITKGVKNLDELQISLAAARVNAGMTQEQVAGKMHVSKQTIVNWEKGKVAPGIPQLEMLCRIYGTHERYIFLPCYSTNSRQAKGFGGLDNPPA